MSFLVNASPPKPLDVVTLILVPDKALGSRWFLAIFHVTDPEVKVKGQIMYFLVNALSLKPLDVAASNFAADRSHNVEDTGRQEFM